MAEPHRICWQWKDGRAPAVKGIWFGGSREKAQAVVDGENRTAVNVEYWLETREGEHVDAA